MRFKTLTESVNWDDFDKFEDIIHKYMPAMGEGETLASQAVTAINKLIYKWYNDGDVYDNRYFLQGWANDLSSYANWLYSYIPQTRVILDRIKKDTDDTYSDTLMLLAGNVLKPEFLAKLETEPKMGSIYEEDGPFEFVEYSDYDEDDDYDYDDEYYESLKESSEEVDDISHLIFDHRYGSKRVEELDVSPLSDIDHYFKLVKTVAEAEKFNYHSDYWGTEDNYQEENIDLIKALTPYINKTVSVDYDDNTIQGKLIGIAIDREYNSISHTKVILDEIKESEESLTETAELDNRVKILKQKITKLDDYGYKNGYDVNIVFDGIKDTVENHLMKYRDELAVVYDSPEFFEEDKFDLDEALGLKEARKKADLVLEEDDLVYNDNFNTIIIPGDLFDDFEESTIISIEFIEQPGIIYEYQMISQDPETLDIKLEIFA